MLFSTAAGFYAGVFYSTASPLYDPPDSEDPDIVRDTCFAPAVDGVKYRGYLLQDGVLRADYYLFA